MADSLQPQIHWDQLDWKKVHLRRSEGHRVRIPKLETSWKAICKRLTRFNKVTTSAELKARMLDQTLPTTLHPPGVEMKIAYELDTLVDYNAPRPSKGWLPLWFHLEGPVFCIKALLSCERDATEGWLDMRRYLATLDDQAYAEAAAEVRSLELQSDREKFLMGYIFPDDPELVQSALNAWHIVTVSYKMDEYAWHLMASMPDLSVVMKRVQTMNHCPYQIRPFLTTFVAYHGAEALPLLLHLVAKADQPGSRRAYASVMSLFEDEDVALFFVEHLDDKAMKDMAARYFRRCPKLAERILPEFSSNTVGKFLRSVLPSHEQQEEPTHVGVPEYLLSPPWRGVAKSQTADSNPVVLDLKSLEFEPKIDWSDDLKQNLLERYAKYQVVGENPEAQVALKERTAFTRWMWWSLERSDYEKYWLEGDLAILNPLDYDRIPPNTLPSEPLALFGTAAIPTAVRFSAAIPSYGLPQLLRVCDPRVAPVMVAQLSGRNETLETAIDWLRAYPRAAALGLIPKALGEPSEQREEAEAGILMLRALGRDKVVLEVAKDYGAEAEAAIQTLLSRDPLLECPDTASKLSKFVELKRLPAPLLSDGRALPPEAVQSILEMIRFSRVDIPYAGITKVKELCQRESLATFAWSLVEQWLESGGAGASKWVLAGLVHFGTDKTARKLSTAVRSWYKDKKKARAQAGLEVLGLIGSDVSLMYLSYFATQGLSTKIREGAAERLKDVAKIRGLTNEELADCSAPDFGLDSNGEMHLELGGRQLSVKFDYQLKPQLWEAGAALSRFPSPRKSDDKQMVKEARTRWKELVKASDMFSAAQVSRLERAMCRRRRWDRKSFETHLVNHPLMRHIVRRLIWASYESGGRLLSTFRVCEDGTFADSEDNEWSFPGGAFLGIAHPLDTSLEIWKELLADYQILQPFRQLGRDVYPSDPALLESFEGLEVPARVLLGLNRLGWKLNFDGSSLSIYERPFGDSRLALWFSPGFERPNLGASGVQTIDGVRWDGELSEVDPVEVSEVVRELESLRAL